MGFFRKKAETAAEEKVVVPCPCEIFGHIWQDFPWIIEDTYDNSLDLPSQIIIKEYYMCRVCHELQEKILWGQCEGLSRKQHDEKVDRIMKQYKDYVKPKPIVMDMIHDMKLVDKEKLKCWEKIHAPTDDDEEEEKENDTGFLSLPQLREK